ncbi:MAG TPA: hypothetical protein VM890_04300 [Longimicrobium sp.]|nr:hypothetical protein [Longimicrobium sp.]
MKPTPVAVAEERVAQACLRLPRPETRVVALERNAADLWIRVYQDGVLSDEASDAIEAATGTAMAGIEGVTHHGSLIRSDAPAAVPALGEVIWARPGTALRAWVEGDPS